MADVVILGAGVMGSAMAVPLADNGHRVRLVGTHLDREIIDAIRSTGVHPGLGRELPSAVRPYQLEDAEAAFAEAEIVVSGVNSVGVEWAGERLAELLRPGQLVIAVSKGVRVEENGDLRILPDVLAEPVPTDVREQVGWAAIIGPAIAGEVAARRETCVVFCGRDEAVVDRLAETFRTGWYHVWTSTDFVGGEICAATKNCYALGIGLAEGEIERRGEAESPDRAHNYEAALFAQSATEIRRWAALFGGDPETALWLPGVGDLYVTSTGGRNVRVGRLLGSGLGFADAAARLGNPTLEGAEAIEVFGDALGRLTERGVVGQEDFPLMRHLYEVIALERAVDIPWSRFFGGEPARAA
ncbi:MAG TPA: 2-dehydropantoate 2-reductase N-terminal domain-containing protein [Solirubrobacteraceae bacterium]